MTSQSPLTRKKGSVCVAWLLGYNKQRRRLLGLVRSESSPIQPKVRDWDDVNRRLETDTSFVFGLLSQNGVPEVKLNDLTATWR